VTLTWSPPSSGGAPTGYKIYRGTNKNNLNVVVTVDNVTTYPNTGLTSGTTYHYRVAGTNDAGEGPRSNRLSARAL
jgi:cellulose 1,4-beta-cellobiosidase